MNQDQLTVHLDAHSQTLARIEQKVDKTNGRVTALELWRARIMGAWFVVSLAGPIVTALTLKALGG